MKPLFERFLAKIEPEPNTGCWLWAGAIDSNGYGSICTWTRHTEKAHRVSYVLLIGPIPEKLQLDHLCRVRCCVNPAHLEAVTQKVNVLRGHGICAQESRRTSCPHGHEYTPKNTVRHADGKRRCRTCIAINPRGRRAAA